jgi:hypothetical protein
LLVDDAGGLFFFVVKALDMPLPSADLGAMGLIA